jgi:hypothetical protein
MKDAGNGRELAVRKGQAPTSFMAMALEKNVTPEQIEKMLALQERWDANNARKAYAGDFAKAQAEIGPVVKKATNPQTKSKYALLEDVIDVTQPIYTKYGFSIIFYEGETVKPEHVRINADVIHFLGHKETYYYDVPMDGKGIQGNANMTKIHAKASSVAYGRRYLMYMIWNVSTHDDDGNLGGERSVEYITETQISTITDMVNSKNIDLTKFLAYMGVEYIDKIQAKDFNKAMTSLRAAKGTVK